MRSGVVKAAARILRNSIVTAAALAGSRDLSATVDLLWKYNTHCSWEQA